MSQPKYPTQFEDPANPTAIDEVVNEGDYLQIKYNEIFRMLKAEEISQEEYEDLKLKIGKQAEFAIDQIEG